MRERSLSCSFCGRTERQVAKLVAGPKVHICDACVALAQRAMDEGDPRAPQLEPPRPLWVRVLAWLRPSGRFTWRLAADL